MNKDGLYTVETALKMTRQEIRNNYKKYINPIKVQVLSLIDFDRHYVRAQGSYLWDIEGNCYLDFLGAYGALNLGHNHPAVREALKMVENTPKLVQASLNGLASALAYNLARIAPEGLTRSFFCNSGAEAVEGALKLARAATGRSKIIYCENSFHGKTMGALSVTGRKKYQKPFSPLVPDCVAIPFGDPECLERELSKGEPAAFIVEPIQGEAGVVIPPQGYLKEARRLCSMYNALLVVDEVQTGFGRTGRMFACEWENVEPDIMCLAKSLGGGIMPIGAYISSEEIWNKAYGNYEKHLLHTSTFGENTWAVTAGLATINVLLEEKIPEEVGRKSELFLKKLKGLQEKYSLIKEVRGRGLLVGVEFQEAGGLLDKISGGLFKKVMKEYLASLVAGELLNKYRILTAYTFNNPNVIRLEPPLVIEEQDLIRAVNALEEIVSSPGGAGGVALAGGRRVLSSILKK